MVRYNQTEISTFRLRGNIVVRIPRENKKWLIVKPTQAGKTREVLDDIVGEHRESGRISVVYCDNSLLQTKQTRLRAEERKVCRSEGGTEELLKVVEISSSRMASTDNWQELYVMVINGEVDVIMACGNPTQFDNISKVIQQCGQDGRQKKFEIFVDEADKVATSENVVAAITGWDKGAYNVVAIKFITATPQDSPSNGLFSLYGEFNLHKLNYGPYNLETYVTLDDVEKEYISPTNKYEDAVKYAERILNTRPFKRGIPGQKMGDYCFVPASYRRESHSKMENMLVNRGCVVVVLNGVDKQVTINYQGSGNGGGAHDKIDLKKTLMKNVVCDVIFEQARTLAKAHGVPLVITGNICVSRGVTLQCKGLVFTRAIFGPGVAPSPFHSMEKAKAYQLFGRILGNIKQFPGWKPCLVHCPKKAFEIASNLEKLAIRIVERSEQGGNEIQTMDHDDFRDDWGAIKGTTAGVIIKKFPTGSQCRDGKIPANIYEGYVQIL